MHELRLRLKREIYLSPSSPHKLTSSGFFFLESHMDMVRKCCDWCARCVCVRMYVWVLIVIYRFLCLCLPLQCSGVVKSTDVDGG